MTDFNAVASGLAGHFLGAPQQKLVLKIAVDRRGSKQENWRC
jgi:hypothetical protein